MGANLGAGLGLQLLAGIRRLPAPGEISLIAEGVVLGVPAALAAAAQLADYIGKRRDLARARRCWDRFCRGAGPRAFAGEGGEVLAVAASGVLGALRRVPDLRWRVAYAACCSGGRDSGSLPPEWEWAVWPCRYRHRVRVGAFAASDLEEVEARLSAAGLQKLPPEEFWELVQDSLAFLRQWRKVAAEMAGAV